MATVRLSIRPDEETEVPDEEVPILRQQGLLIEDGGKKPSAPNVAGGSAQSASQEGA